MKYTYLLFVLLVSCMLPSCRNYKQELKALASTLNRNGTLIDMNEEVHMLIYEEDGCIKANNMDSCWTVFSPKKPLKTYVYQISVEENGKINIITKKEDINLPINNISYGIYSSFSNDIKVDNNKFSHIETTIHHKEEGQIRWYYYDSRQPDLVIPELSTVSIFSEFGEEADSYEEMRDASWNSVSVNASLLSDKLNETYQSLGMELEPLPGTLTVYFRANKNGKVENISNIMKYSSEAYGLLYKVETFKNIDEISNFYYNISMNIREIQRKNYIESEKHNFIKIEDIDKAYKANFVRADEQYKGKIVRVACSLDQIKKNDNIIFFTDYKYKLSYSNLFGFDIVAYSNDENLVNLNYPANIYMEATLYSAEKGNYIFTNCQLMMVE